MQTIIFYTILFVLPLSAKAALTVPSTSTGTYTVSWTESSAGQQIAYLHEKTESGSLTKYNVTGLNSKSFTKLHGTYSYSLQLCYYETVLFFPNLIFGEVCGQVSDSVTITVNPEPPSLGDVKHIVILAIDALKPNILRDYLQSSESEGGVLRELALNSIWINATTTFPSVTFTAWASMVTGVWPKKHGILGNEWFDRTIQDKKHRTRSYTGTSLKAINDIVRVYGFTGCGGIQDDHFPWVGDICISDVYREGLANKDLQAKTIYEYVSEAGLKAVVSYHMYWKPLNWGKPDGHGTSYIHPSREDLKIWDQRSKEYDTHAAEKLIAYLDTHEVPTLMTIYFSGFDHRSHARSSEYQREMLKKYDSRPNPILPMLINKLKAKQVYNNTVFFIISDHGQTDINGDEAHSIVLDKIKEVVEDSKYGDIYDFYLPDEEEEYDSVAVFNSGMLGIYLKQRTREGDPTKWRDGSIPVWPRFEEDVFHVVKWINKHRTAGDEDQFYKAGEDAVEEILVALRPGRDAEPLYRIVKNNMDFPDCMGPVGPEGLFHCGIWHIQEAHPDYVDAVRRIENYGHPTRSADIIILPKYKKGFHFSSEDNKSEHGSLYPEDSHITFVIAGLPIGRGDPNGRNTQVFSLQSIVDIAPTITYLLGLGGSFDGKSVLKPGCFEGRNSPFMAIDEPSNWYNPNPFGPPKCSFDMTPFMKIVPFIEEPHLFNKIP